MAQASVTEFMEGAVNWLYDRPLFKTANDATVEYARDQLEKCVFSPAHTPSSEVATVEPRLTVRCICGREIMVKLHPRVFVASPEEAAEDAAFYERCKRLQFLTADMLDVPPGCNNEVCRPAMPLCNEAVPPAPCTMLMPGAVVPVV